MKLSLHVSNLSSLTVSSSVQNRLQTILVVSASFITFSIAPGSPVQAFSAQPAMSTQVEATLYSAQPFNPPAPGAPTRRIGGGTY